MTYGIVVFKAYRARSRSGKIQQTGLLAFAGDENVQYLGKSFGFHRWLHLRLLVFFLHRIVLFWCPTNDPRSVRKQWHSCGSSFNRSHSRCYPSRYILCSTWQHIRVQTSFQHSNLQNRLQELLQAAAQQNPPHHLPIRLGILSRKTTTLR